MSSTAPKRLNTFFLGQEPNAKRVRFAEQVANEEEVAPSTSQVTEQAANESAPNDCTHVNVTTGSTHPPPEPNVTV